MQRQQLELVEQEKTVQVVHEILCQTIYKEQLFDFLGALFTNKEKYARYSRKVKIEHFFMSQRFIAIMYPILVQHSNKIGIDVCAILDMYHIKLCGSTKNVSGQAMVPKWIYTRHSDDSLKPQTNSAINYDKKVIMHFCNMCNVEYSTFHTFALKHEHLAYQALESVKSMTIDTITESK